MAGAERRRYRAFISYSQRDMTTAQRLHKALENYRVPLGISPDLVKSKRRLLGRFFRDVEDMSAASDISATVRGAIEDSESLIVLCSPRSAQSRWVDTEVQHFRTTGRGDRIFAVIIDGEPNTGDPATECFPPSLRLDAGPDLHPDDMPVEPVGIDMRIDSLERVCSRIAAGLLGVPFDALWQRRRREAIRQWWIRGGVGFAVALLAFASIVGIGAGQVRRTLETRSALFAAQSERAMDAGEETAAARYAAAGLVGADMPFFSFNARAAEAALRRALSGRYVFRLESSDDVIFSPAGDQLVSFDPDEKKLSLRQAQTGALIADLSDDGSFITAAFSPDGKRLLLGGQRGAVAIADARDGKILQRLPALPATIRGVAFSADGKRMLVGGERAVLIHDAESGARLAAIATTAPMLGASFAADGAEALTVEADGMVRRWRTSDGAALAAWRATKPGQIATLAIISPDGARLLTLLDNPEGNSGAALLHDASGRLLAAWPESAEIGAAAFSPYSRHLVLAGDAGAPLLVDARSGRRITALQADTSDPDDIGAAYAIAFSADGESVLTSSLSAPVAHVWTLRGRHVARLPSQNRAMIQSIAVSPKGDQIALVSGDGGSAEIWRTETARRAETKGEVAILPTAAWRYLMPSSARRSVMISGGLDGTAIFDPAKPENPARLLPGSIILPAIDVAGARVITASGGEAVVWDAATGKMIGAPRPLGGDAVTAGFRGAAPLAVANRADGASVIDLDSGRIISRLEDFGAGDIGLTFSNDGETLHAQRDNAPARFWRVVDGREITALAGKFASYGAIDMSRDGALILGEKPEPDPGEPSSTVHVHDLRTGRLVRAWQARDGVGLSRFGPDSMTVATAVADNSVRLWRVDTGAETAALRGFSGQIAVMDFSPDGRLIVTFGLDDVVRVWDAASGTRLLAYEVDGLDLMDGAFAADGRAVVAYAAAPGAGPGRARQVHMWRLPESFSTPRDTLLRRACDVMLSNGASVFGNAERARVSAPRTSKPVDACRAPTVWDRVAQAIGLAR